MSNSKIILRNRMRRSRLNIVGNITSPINEIRRNSAISGEIHATLIAAMG